MRALSTVGPKGVYTCGRGHRKGVGSDGQGDHQFRGDGNRFVDEQDCFVVSLEQATFRGKVGYVCGFGPRMRGNAVTKSNG